MHSQFNSIMLDLHVGEIEKLDQDIFIHAYPVDYTQPCPVCSSDETIRKGCAYIRKVRQQLFHMHQSSLKPPLLRLTGRLNVG